MKNINVHIVGSVGLPARYGGWETLADHLVSNASSQIKYHVYCSSKRYPERICFYKGATHKYINLSPNGFSSIFYDFVSMWKSRKTADIQLVLGVSGCIFLPLIKLFSASKFVVNIDGLEWRRDKWGFFARKFLKFSEFLAVKYADQIITDNVALREYVFATYKKLSEVITYGGDHVGFVPVRKTHLETYPFLNGQYFFSVARVEPENNVHLILDAFSKMKEKNFVFVGNWDNSVYGKKIKNKFSTFPNIFLLDAIYDLQTLDLLRSNASVYLHGHSAGGTNPSLVEAMSLGICVIAYDVVFNRQTTMNKAFYFDSVSGLVTLVEGLSERDINECASANAITAAEHYTWDRIVRSYENLYVMVMN